MNADFGLNHEEHEVAKTRRGLLIEISRGRLAGATADFNRSDVVREGRPGWVWPAIGVIAVVFMAGAMVGIHILQREHRRQWVAAVTIDYPGATAKQYYDVVATWLPSAEWKVIDARENGVTGYATNASALKEEEFLRRTERSVARCLPANATLESIHLVEDLDSLPAAVEKMAEFIEITPKYNHSQELGLPALALEHRLHQVAPADLSGIERLQRINSATIEIKGKTVPLIELIHFETKARPARIVEWR